MQTHGNPEDRSQYSDESDAAIAESARQYLLMKTDKRLNGYMSVFRAALVFNFLIGLLGRQQGSTISPYLLVPGVLLMVIFLILATLRRSELRSSPTSLRVH